MTQLCSHRRLRILLSVMVLGLLVSSARADWQSFYTGYAIFASSRSHTATADLGSAVGVMVSWGTTSHGGTYKTEWANHWSSLWTTPVTTGSGFQGTTSKRGSWTPPSALGTRLPTEPSRTLTFCRPKPEPRHCPPVVLCPTHHPPCPPKDDWGCHGDWRCCCHKHHHHCHHTPEPSTLVLWGIGLPLLGLGVLRGRARR